MSTAVEFIVNNELPKGSEIKHYLDDFLAGAKDMKQCNKAVRKIIKVCKDLGIPISDEKTIWATQLICFLGLDLDMVQQLILIPEHKIQLLLNKLNHVLSSKNIKVKTLQSLAGSLNFYCQVKPSAGHS